MKPYYQDEYVTLYCGDCLEVMPTLDVTFDACITDPPYEYIQSLEWDKNGFDKTKFVGCLINALSKNSMLAMFGRGSSFYRLNCLLEDAGLKFKEEIIWNKRQSTSPCMALLRVHETVSVFSKGKAIIQRSKISYLEKKQFDIQSICMDVKRLASALKNPQELQEILKFLELNGKVEIYDKERTHKYQVSQQESKGALRGVATVAQIKNGMTESSIIRCDRELNHVSKHCITTTEKLRDGMRSVNTMQSIAFGLNESSIFEEQRDHYKSEHPTQKPVRLFERILNVISASGSTILDPFAGSGTTGVAAKRLNRKCTLIEKEEKYCEIAARRLSQGVLPLWEMQEVE
jgi:site-specific DNA-methyltransferase (adenine-specific)